MSELITEARAFRAKIELLSQHAPDEEAVDAPDCYPVWSYPIPYTVGFKVRNADALYKCLQAHTSQSDWPPYLTPSLWEVINETHSGTIDDPIPAALGMTYYNGLYYSEGDALYLCIRDSGTPLYHLPSALVGNYFEEVTN